MKLTNAMEATVKSHLNRLRAQTQGDETCWCPLCRADMLALALSSLPPRYATRRPEELDADPRTADAIRAEVARAIRHVERFPKHSSGGAVAAGEPVWVVNYPLEESFRTIEGLLLRHDDVCDCWHCRCDMVAFALNRYPARYGVEHAGHTRLCEEDREQMRTEITSFLDLAIRVVSTVPRHEAAGAASA